jgi:hypothetical protein
VRRLVGIIKHFKDDEQPFYSQRDIPIHSVVLDLDDTLNSCTMHVLKTLGCGVHSFEYCSFPPDIGYNLIEAWSHFTGRDPVDPAMFWEWVSRKTWAQMPRSSQFWLIESAALMVGIDNVLIATVPTKSPDCLFGKYEWMEQHLPPWMSRQYNITPRKWRLSVPGALLIDDADHNIDQWKRRPDGMPSGDAILVPRPWNSLHEIGVDPAATSQYLAKELSKRKAINLV